MTTEGLGRAPVAGVLLTGGASTRMGVDKASIVVDGQTLAERLGALLATGLAGPCIEAGPGRSGLPAVPDEAPGRGPLAAIAGAALALGRTGWRGPAIVLACDLPRFSAAALDLLARWRGDGAAVPVVGGRRQPLCARWASADLAAAMRLADGGQRSLRGLPGAAQCDLLDAATWGPAVGVVDFIDADTPAELAVTTGEGSW